CWSRGSSQQAWCSSSPSSPRCEPSGRSPKRAERRWARPHADHGAGGRCGKHAPMRSRGHGRLAPTELAEAAVLGDVALVLAFAGWLLPLSVLFWAAASVPYAVLTARRRLRAVVISGVASGQVA